MEHAEVDDDWDVTYTYDSPVDGRRHPGAFRTADPLYSQHRPGDEIDVLAHKAEAGKSRERALLD